jgi:phosphoglycolate phosphatase
MKKLVIFDLDGTLLDTVEDLAEACNHILRQEGFPQYPIEQYRIFVGNGITKLIERALPAEVRTPEYIEALRLRFVDYYTRHIDRRTTPYKGISELLTTLHSRGVGLAVASNKFQSGTLRLVERFFPAIPFVAVMGQREGVPTKPDPAVVRQIISMAGVGPDETLYVGDSDVDMLTAHNAGVTSVGVVWGFRGEKELIESGADHIVEHPSEILHIFETYPK